MDRRSGLQKAHFSSVPTRMSLFTCKKYVFLIEKNFPPHPKIGKTQHNALYESRWKLSTTLSMNRVGNSAQRFPMGRVGKLNTTLSYGSRWKTQHNAFLWVALENSTQRFPMGRVVGWELSFTEDFVVIPTIDLEIQLFVGKVMGRSAWWELSFTEDLL
ncbi:hypothetical protein LEP1GSC204_0331 [Leptospira interrogans serovar Copenhageni str. M20]|nr:hypothetical protein LEP1GSC204_0331 [Leptospira interrogans serovar Copenhageni str. M20]